MVKKRRPTASREAFDAQVIRLGGELMTRGQAVTLLTSEGYSRTEVDALVFGPRVQVATEQDLIQEERNSLLFLLVAYTQRRKERA